MFSNRIQMVEDHEVVGFQMGFHILVAFLRWGRKKEIG